MKLTAKLLSLLVAVALVPLITVSALSFQAAGELLTSSIHTELATKTASELADIEKHLAVSVGDLHTWTRLRIMQDVLTDDADGELSQELAQQGEDIGRIVDVIAEIAAQANILALNATIEAAAAGERGAGFSVVASEMRTLSQRTSAATAQVQSIIGGLRARTDDAVRAMETGRGRARESVERARAVTQALEMISESIATISQMSEQIAEATGHQVAAIDTVRDHLQRVRNISDGTASGARETASSTELLSEQITTLSALVGQFKIA